MTSARARRAATTGAAEPRRGGDPVALELFGQKGFHDRDLAAARVHVRLGKKAHVLDVEQAHPADPGHRRVDVTRNGNVDDQKGTVGSASSWRAARAPSREGPPEPPSM